MARYFVTGATGFLGRELVKQLVSRGHHVVALARSPQLAGVLRAMGVELHEGDITDRSSLRAPMTGADGVFHVAGWCTVGAAGSLAMPVNVDGTRNVLETMRDLAIPKGVLTSTVAVFSDTHGEVPDEQFRYDGPHLSECDRTKWLAHYEVALPMMAAGLPLSIVMPGLVYGPNGTCWTHRAIVALIRGRCPVIPARTAFCWGHVEDTARGHILAMEKGTPGETYLITGPRHTFRDAFDCAAAIAKARRPRLHPSPAMMRAAASLMGAVGRVVNLPPAYTEEGLRAFAGVTYYGSNQKAVSELGFTARPLGEGLEQTIEHERLLLSLREPQY